MKRKGYHPLEIVFLIIMLGIFFLMVVFTSQKTPDLSEECECSKEISAVHPT